MHRFKQLWTMAVRKRYAALLMVFFLVAYLLPLGARDLLAPDETRYAEIPREMIAGGDWVTPHLNGLRYFEKRVMAGAGIAFMVCFCSAAMYTRNNRSRILWIGLAPLLLFFVAHFAIPDVVLQKNDPGRLLRENRARIGSDAVVISCDEAVSAVCWNLKRDAIYLLKSAGELDYGLTYGDAVGRLLDPGSAASLIDQYGGKAVLISRAKRIRELHSVLPVLAYQEESGPVGFVLWRF